MTETKKSKSGTATKVLMPVVATVASAAASYLAKKGPQYIEQAIMPKLRETKDSAGGVASGVAERAKSVVGADGDGGDSGDGGESGNGNSSRSMDELTERRRERAEHRAARRKAS
jgi:hypothetical protein